MATHYVDSNATGADDGTSFTDAFPSITDLPTLSAGDIVLIASDHSESISGTTTLGNTGVSNWIYYISVNSSTEVFAAGASITISTGNAGGDWAYLVGITLTISTGDLVTANSLRPLFLEECDVDCDNVELVNGGFVQLLNTTLECRNTFQAVTARQGFIMVGGVLNASVLSTGDSIINRNGTDDNPITLIGVDIQGSSEFLYSPSNEGRVCECFIHNCKLPSGIGFVDNLGNFGEGELEVINSIIGTSTVAVTQYYYASRYRISRTC